MPFVSSEDKFGIKIQNTKAPETIGQNFSLVAGITYLAGGIIGFFITGSGNITEMTNHAIGSICTLATVIGFLGYLSLLSIPGGLAGDNFPHLVTAVATLIFGTGILSAMNTRQPVTT